MRIADTTDARGRGGLRCRRPAGAIGLRHGTPEDLTTMPPAKLVARSKNANVVYAHAGPENCHSLYLGGAKEFSEYQVTREVDRDLSDASLNWEAWGLWWW